MIWSILKTALEAACTPVYSVHSVILATWKAEVKRITV
jgi:hypothetical protein